mmetsp:Transcript_2954/g.8194  ORF Transcript_2954/g.8194 Transcript_2954/m.8194 type:complete len:241 (-) Transcript_2954:292-1014(-)
MLPMTLHGMVPKMPCMIITQNVGMRKKRVRLWISSTTALQPPPPSLWFTASSLGGSFMKTSTRADTMTETRPMRQKATRQPWMPRTSMFAIGTATRVVMSMPNMREDWTLPNILPRFDSAVMSATMPLEMGRRAARSAPFAARMKIIGPMMVTRARRHVTKPCPSEPMIKMLLRWRMPRSAMMPQNGAARFVHTACAVLRYARSDRCKPMSFCRASIAAGSSAVSAPSRAATAQSRNCIR